MGSWILNTLIFVIIQGSLHQNKKHGLLQNNVQVI